MPRVIQKHLPPHKLAGLFECFTLQAISMPTYPEMEVKDGKFRS